MYTSTGTSEISVLRVRKKKTRRKKGVKNPLNIK